MVLKKVNLENDRDGLSDLIASIWNNQTGEIGYAPGILPNKIKTPFIKIIYAQ